MGTFNACATPLGAAQGQGRDSWDAVPHEYREFQRRGFRDGLNAAQRDFEEHRRADVNSREELRHPNTPPEMANDYREGFRRGYDTGVRHFYSSAMPSEHSAERHEDGQRDNAPYDRMGYNDGLIGAQKDFENHRRPDVNNRDEFRNPNVPSRGADEYRAGFRRGYEQGVRNNFPNGAPAVMPWEQSNGRWDDAPNDFNEIRRHGFHDGMTAAQRDYDNQRRPDADQHEEFRHPGVPYQSMDEYREGFRRGYDVATRHLYPNGPPTLFPGEQPPSPWLAIPRESPQMQKVGYLDGILAAGQDYEAGLAPSVDSHDEYRSSKLGFLVRLIYKQGYKTGYELATHNFADRIVGTGAPQQRRGFLDGVAAIRQDYEAKRRPNMNVHAEFNNPPVAPNAQEEYREAYRSGFDMAASYLY